MLGQWLSRARKCWELEVRQGLEEVVYSVTNEDLKSSQVSSIVTRE